jgi:hypothetical protein
MLDANKVNPKEHEDFFQECQHKLVTKTAMQIHEKFSARNSAGMTMIGEPGDYLVVDKRGRREIIPRLIFEKDWAFLHSVIDEKVKVILEKSAIPAHFDDESILFISGYRNNFDEPLPEHFPLTLTLVKDKTDGTQFIADYKICEAPALSNIQSSIAENPQPVTGDGVVMQLHDPED